MGKYRYVDTDFWKDDYIFGLAPLEKFLFHYLLTNPAATICGVYRVPIRIIVFETGIPEPEVKQIIERLTNDGKITYVLQGWVCLINKPKYLVNINAKQRTGVEREIGEVPPEVISTLPIPYTEGMQRLGIAFNNLNSNLNPDIRLEPKPSSSKAEASSATTQTAGQVKSQSFDLFWSAYPRKVKKKEARQIWIRNGLDAKAREIIDFVQKAKETKAWREKEFIPHPTTFLEGEQWTDDLQAYAGKILTHIT